MQKETVLEKVKKHPYLAISETVYISPEELSPHPERNLFPPMPPEQRKLLSESIEKDGILHNLVVADKSLLHPDKYTILSGHHRWEIASTLGIKNLPCRVVRLSKEGQKLLSPKDIYRLFLEIFIEANLAQRILDPSTYIKCLEKRNMILVRIDPKFSESLLPEFRSALSEGSLSIQLARALARFPLEEQRKFLSLIGGKYGKVQSKDLDSLEEALKESKNQLAAASFEIEKLKREKEELEERIQTLSDQKVKDERAIQAYVREKHALQGKIRELEYCLSLSKTGLSPEVVSRIKNLQRTVSIRDEEIKKLQEQLAEIESQTETLREQLKQKEKEAQEKVRKAQEEFQKQLEQLKKERSTKKDHEPPIRSPSFQRYKVFLETILAILDEIRGDNTLKEPEKKELIQLLQDVSAATRITEGLLKGKSPAEILGIKGNGLLSSTFEEDDETLEDETGEEPADLYDLYAKES